MQRTQCCQTHEGRLCECGKTHLWDDLGAEREVLQESQGGLGLHRQRLQLGCLKLLHTRTSHAHPSGLFVVSWKLADVSHTVSVVAMCQDWRCTQGLQFGCLKLLHTCTICTDALALFWYIYPLTLYKQYGKTQIQAGICLVHMTQAVYTVYASTAETHSVLLHPWQLR